MADSAALRQAVKAHYEKYVYPRFSLLTSVRLCDTYALNLDALWARFNGEWLAAHDKKILLAGCGSFSPYPTAVANKKAQITALDLSKANLDRAKLHTRLHFCFNIEFIEGDILNAKSLLAEKRFHFIDCYGVLHHIPDLVLALKSLHSLLEEGAIARIMVYSTQARQSIQAVRTAMKILHIDKAEKIRALYKKAKENSRFRDCIESNYESKFDWGLADMFLHPYAKTFKIDELLDTLQQARLEPILFIHPNACINTAEEIQRLRKIESNNGPSTNFIFFAGCMEDTQKRRAWQHAKQTQDICIALNPVIKKALSLFPFPPLKPGQKLGFENPAIDFKANRLLAHFQQPLRKSTLSPDRWDAIQPYLQAMFLIETANPS